MSRAQEIRRAFEKQAAWCEKLGSPFTARLCAVLARILHPGTAVGRRVLAWEGDPDEDALALRLCGALNALVRAGRTPRLARFHPPETLPDEAAFGAELERALDEQASWIDPWLDRAPQTNEVGRAAVLMGGLLAAAARFGLPLRLFELGASAGLNLQLDRYGYDLGGLAAGRADSALQLKPDWKGPPPPDAPVRIVGRAGVDLNPLDPVGERERLLAYVWPDQPARLGRIESALDIARADPPKVDRADAADWLEARLAVEPEAGVCRMVLHSVAFPYFPPATRQRLAARLEVAGARAGESAPLAWLRLEKLEADDRFSLRLRTWPGEDRRLAWSHPHGTWVDWQGS